MKVISRRYVNILLFVSLCQDFHLLFCDASLMDVYQLFWVDRYHGAAEQCNHPRGGHLFIAQPSITNV